MLSKRFLIIATTLLYASHVLVTRVLASTTVDEEVLQPPSHDILAPVTAPSSSNSAGLNDVEKYLPSPIHLEAPSTDLPSPRPKQVEEGKDDNLKQPEPIDKSSTVEPNVVSVTDEMSTIWTAFKRHEIESNGEPFRILLLGQSGSGKSSILSLLKFFAQSYGTKSLPSGASFSKGDLDHLCQFGEDIKLEELPQGQSQTLEATSVKLKMPMGVTIEVIDTPGFGDTRGIAQDHENATKIVKELKRLRHINCVFLVLNGASSARNATSMEYAMKRLRRMLPRSVIGNVMVIFTRAFRRNRVEPHLADFVASNLLGIDGDVRMESFIDNPIPVAVRTKLYWNPENAVEELEEVEELFSEAMLRLKELFARVVDLPRMDVVAITKSHETVLSIEERCRAFVANTLPDTLEAVALQLRSRDQAVRNFGNLKWAFSNVKYSADGDSKRLNEMSTVCESVRGAEELILETSRELKEEIAKLMTVLHRDNAIIDSVVLQRFIAGLKDALNSSQLNRHDPTRKMLSFCIENNGVGLETFDLHVESQVPDMNAVREMADQRIAVAMAEEKMREPAVIGSRTVANAAIRRGSLLPITTSTAPHHQQEPGSPQSRGDGRPRNNNSLIRSIFSRLRRGLSRYFRHTLRCISSCFCSNYSHYV